MIYKVGQKVRVIPHPPHKESGSNDWCWVSDMNKYCGKILVISQFGVQGKDDCHLEDNQWGWSNEWLLPLSKFQEGDIVKHKSTGQYIVLSMPTGEIPYKDKDLELISRKQLI